MLTIETPTDVELRTALSLSAATGAPVHLEAVGHGTERPGVWRRHLAWGRAAAAACGGQLDAALGAAQLVHTPGAVVAGAHRLAIGLGHGAVELALVALPAALVAPGRVELTVQGATHAPGQGYQWLTRALAPWLAAMGRELALTVDEASFPPAGGRLRLSITPAAPVARPVAEGVRAIVTVGHLPDGIASREVGLLRERGVVDVEVIEVASLTPGNAVCLEVATLWGLEVFEACGARAVSGASLIEALWKRAESWRAAEAQVSPAAADVLLVAMALAGGGEFTASGLSPHTERIAEITEKFVDVEVSMVREGERVSIGVRP